MALFSLKNSNKFRINSNKLGQMRIKLEQTCGLTLVGRKQSDLTYNSANYEGKKQSDLTYNLQTDCGLTVVGREQSDLTYNSAN